MGPPPFGSGNFSRSACLKASRLALQWGHRLSAVETRMNEEESFYPTWAAMGPPPFGSGNVGLGARRVRGLLLQWGHRLSAVETGTVWLNYGDAYRLQWGHRLSAVETRRPAGTGGRPPPRCNGATAFRQWKRHSDLDGGLGLFRLQWATAFRQWKRPTRRRSSLPSPSCNGATAFRQWKLASPAITVDNLGPAAMGPPPFGSGNSGSGTFTEATPSALQWGHRLSAVETVRSLGGVDVDRPAAMGPPPFGSGNFWVRHCALGSLNVLQWGHRLSAVETHHADAGGRS